ncbi:unnamed protein product [Brassica oleracea var. botrytis]
MTSEKQLKAERAEVAARLAAEDLHDINKHHRDNVTMYKVTERTVEHPREQERPGVIGSVFRAVKENYVHARDAVVGKSHDVAESTREGAQIASEKAAEAKDATLEKAKDTADYTAEKAREAKDKTAEKIGEYKDYTVDKAVEAKDKAAEKAKETANYTADKAKEAKDKTAEKVGEYKDYTTAEKAGEYKDYTVEKAAEGKDAGVSKLGELKDSAKVMIFWDVTLCFFMMLNEKMEEAGEEARRKMEEMRLEGKELKDEARDKAREGSQKTKESAELAAERAHETKDSATIFGTLENVTEAIKNKLTMPSDIVEETRVARERGSTGRTVVEVTVEDTKPSKVAATLKASDQMTGQTFNDVGRMDY